MRAARFCDRCLVLRDISSSFGMRACRRARPLGGVGERVVEGVEGAVRCDRDLEAVAEALVLDGDGNGDGGRVPEQPNADAVTVAGGELARPGCRAGERWPPSLSRAAGSRAWVAGLMAPPSRANVASGPVTGSRPR